LRLCADGDACGQRKGENRVTAFKSCKHRVFPIAFSASVSRPTSLFNVVFA
jgi:hypothetical protein